MNKGDTILVLSTSRLSRNSIFALNLLEKLKLEDKFIWFINENIDTRTPHGYLVATMLFGVAQYQVQETKARIRSTLALKKKKGEFIGRIPYGYKLENGEGSNLIIDDYQQDIITVIKYLRNDYNFSYELIAKILNDNEITTKRKNTKWKMES